MQLIAAVYTTTGKLMNTLTNTSSSKRTKEDLIGGFLSMLSEQQGFLWDNKDFYPLHTIRKIEFREESPY